MDARAVAYLLITSYKKTFIDDRRDGANGRTVLLQQISFESIHPDDTAAQTCSMAEATSSGTAVKRTLKRPSPGTSSMTLA